MMYNYLYITKINLNPRILMKERTSVLIYVDDIMVLSHTDSECEKVKDILKQAFGDITEKEGSKLSFIGMEILET